MKLLQDYSFSRRCIVCSLAASFHRFEEICRVILQCKPWRWGQYIPLKPWSLANGLDCVTSRNTVIFMHLVCTCMYFLQLHAAILCVPFPTSCPALSIFMQLFFVYLFQLHALLCQSSCSYSLCTFSNFMPCFVNLHAAILCVPFPTSCPALSIFMQLFFVYFLQHLIFSLALAEIFFPSSWPLTHYSGRVTQICVFNTVKLGTSASSP